MGNWRGELEALLHTAIQSSGTSSSPLASQNPSLSPVRESKRPWRIVKKLYDPDRAAECLNSPYITLGRIQSHDLS
jgi:hypothetical protein